MTKRKWVVVQHVPYEGPGLIGELALVRGLEIEVCHVYEGRSLPRADELEGLVVMGGPMGVHDTVEHPHLLGELELITGALADGTPILGVCLGAQLLARSLGARIYPGERAEIGAGTVTLTPEGSSDPVLGAPDRPQLPVFHWHGETFDLPPQALRLAGSELYANQAFRFGHCAYGFQFHVELDAQLAQGWREHLPVGTHIDDTQQTRIAQVGHTIISAFFDRATSGPKDR